MFVGGRGVEEPEMEVEEEEQRDERRCPGPVDARDGHRDERCEREAGDRHQPFRNTGFAQPGKVEPERLVAGKVRAEREMLLGGEIDDAQPHQRIPPVHNGAAANNGVAMPFPADMAAIDQGIGGLPRPAEIAPARRAMKCRNA